MKTIERIDATDSLARYMERAEDLPIVITEHGQPVAALLSVPNADLETVSLSTNSQFLSLIAHSRDRQEKEGGISSREMRSRFAAESPAEE